MFIWFYNRQYHHHCFLPTTNYWLLIAGYKSADYLLLLHNHWYLMQHLHFLSLLLFPFFFFVLSVPNPINSSAIQFEFLRTKIEKNGCCGSSELIKLNSYRWVSTCSCMCTYVRACTLLLILLFFIFIIDLRYLKERLYVVFKLLDSY